MRADVIVLPETMIDDRLRLSDCCKPFAAATLYDFVQCPTRVALDAFAPAKRDPINPFVRLLWERGTLFEEETVAEVEHPFTDLSRFKGDEKERLTLEAMHRSHALIYSGRIATDDLLGIPDTLRKEGSGYTPGEIKSGAGEPQSSRLVHQH